MPQAIATAAQWVYTTWFAQAGAAAASAATAATVYTVAYYAATAALIAGSIAYSSDQKRKARHALEDLMNQGRTTMVRGSVQSQELVYGDVKKSGAFYPIAETGENREYFYFIVVLAGHEIESIDHIYFDDVEVPIMAGGSGEATGDYAGYVRIGKFLGASGGERDLSWESELTDIWTANHLGENIARLHVRLKWNAELFPTGVPNITARLKGKRVYDPRTGSTAWSSNVALCAADYLQDQKFGRGIVRARVLADPLIEAANVCDESVLLSDGGSEARYTLNGVITGGASPDDVLRAMAGAMAGRIVDTGGTWTIRAGAWRTPESVGLTDSDLIAPISVQPRQSRQDTFNRVRGTYFSPENNWQVTDFPAVPNSTYKAKDGGIWLDLDVEYPFTTSSATAQRLAKIELERGRQQLTFTALYSLKALRYMPGDVVPVTRERMGWAAKNFEVIEWSFKPTGDDSNPGLGVEMTLRETALGVWEWNDGEETTVDLAPNTNLPDPKVVATPTGLTLTVDDTTGFLQADGTWVPRMLVSWDPPADNYVQQNGRVLVELKSHASSTWRVVDSVPGAQAFTYLADVKTAVAYDVRIRFQNSIGRRGEYLEATTNASGGYIVIAKAAGPTTPSITSIAVGPGEIITLTIGAVSDADFGEFLIYRNTVNDSSTAVKIGELSGLKFVDTSVVGGTTYYYWAATRNRSEVESSKSSEAHATAAKLTVGQSDQSPPADPAAATINTSSTYLAGDGTTYAKLVMNVPAMPTGGSLLNVLYRKNGSAGWIVADQRTSGGGTSAIDDLSPGTSYDVAFQAISAFGVGSGIVAATGSPFTAPNKATAPASPTGLSATAQVQGISLDWSDNSEADLIGYSLYRNTSNTTTGASVIWTGLASAHLDKSATPGTSYYYWVKAINRTGLASGYSSSAHATARLTQTDDIDTDAVTSIVSVVGANAFVAAGDTQTIMSGSIITTGGRVKVDTRITFQFTSAGSAQVGFYRGGTLIDTADLTINHANNETRGDWTLDTPAAGTYTYAIKIINPNDDLNIYGPKATLEETKR